MNEMQLRRALLDLIGQGDKLSHATGTYVVDWVCGDGDDATIGLSSDALTWTGKVKELHAAGFSRQERRNEKADFPMRAVRHLAGGMPCRCQTSARHVEQNIHWPSCIVGQAQEFLGKTVTFCDPNDSTKEPKP